MQIYKLTEEEMYNGALILFEDMCLMLITKGLIQLGMTTPNRPMHDAFNQELRRETQYEYEAFRETALRNVPLLNEQHKYAYDTLMKVVNDGNGRFVFLDAPGGTGKTFLISLILATIRSHFHLLRRVMQLRCWKAVKQLIPHSSCR